MSIPQINEGVTDRNRKQSRRICELKGWAIMPSRSWLDAHVEVFSSEDLHTWNPGDSKEPDVFLPNGSFTLDQVVGMLEGIAEHVNMHSPNLDCGTPAGWYKYTDSMYKRLSIRKWEELLCQTDDPHDLTAAMDALIALEEKKGETDGRT